MKTIKIVSPAGFINPVFIDNTQKILTDNGFNVVIGQNAKNKFNQFAATDDERLYDMQDAINDETVDIILCARGGYGTIKILDKIDFSPLKKKQKFIVGFSDITNFHVAINNLKIKSIHAQMCKAISENTDTEAVRLLIEILKNNYNIDYTINSHKLNRVGEGFGELIGGNLSIIYSLQGTDYEIDTKNKILFLEDLNEYLYHLDRMMTNLKLSGKLANLKGLIVGQFSDMKDNNTPFAKTAYEIINEQISEYDFPVCFNFPVGHIDDNLPLICGENYELKISENIVTLKSCL